MVSGDIYKTKYVTWNNFGLEKNDKDLYAYQLMADIFSQVGIHEGTMMAYHQTQSDNPDYQAYLDGIERLQYDILYGNRYCYDGDINKYPATELIMGVDDVVISEMYPHMDEEGNEWVVLKGESFTMWSRVYVNGEKVGTTYVSGDELWIKASKIKDQDIVLINQVGTKNTIYRSSNEFIYVAPVIEETESTEVSESAEIETTE